MTEDNGNKGRKARTGRMDRDLDRMLDTLVPPVPSDTLRARLKRDFMPGDSGPAHGRDGARGRWWVPLENRIGGIAVAAALVLAVALGVLVTPPKPASPVKAIPVDVAAGNPTPVSTTADDLSADEVLADAAPDSALYMIAAFNPDLVTGSGSAGVGVDTAYDGSTSTQASDTGSFGVMPLE